MTIFHKIAKKEVPSYIVMEDDECIAFLDIYPAHAAQCVVIPKEFTQSQFSLADSEILSKTVTFAQKVAALIEEKIEGVLRCTIAIEGLEIDYLHVKVIPVMKLSDISHDGGEKATELELESTLGKLKN